MQRFSDFAEEEAVLDGNKCRIDDVINQEIILTKAKITESKYKKNKSGKCLMLQIKRTETSNHEVIFTGSDVLIDQIEKYQCEMPFLGTIRKINNRYYTLS